MNVKKNRKKMDHSGSTFDSFLEEEGIREEVEAVAIKRVLAWQLERAMQEQQKTKQAMAKQLHTSRSQLDRLLDPQNVSVTLDTITRAARGCGKRVQYSRGRCEGSEAGSGRRAPAWAENTKQEDAEWKGAGTNGRRADHSGSTCDSYSKQKGFAKRSKPLS